MKRREWIKRLGTAMAGLAVAMRVRGGAFDERTLGQTGADRAMMAKAGGATESQASPFSTGASAGEKERRYVHGFETELMS